MIRRYREGVDVRRALLWLGNEPTYLMLCMRLPGRRYIRLRWRKRSNPALPRHGGTGTRFIFKIKSL